MMNLDFSPIIHAAIAMTLQCAIGLTLDMWGVGGALVCAWFIAREHTQAEYRWIAMFGRGKRANMPWWGGFSFRAWDMASLMDWIAPVIACTSIYFAIA